MDDPSVPWLCRWLELTQDVTIAPELLEEPARVVARIGGLARTAAAALPFDTDPTGFTEFLEALAAPRDGDAS